jgi:Rad3-related DNA helicase
VTVAFDPWVPETTADVAVESVKAKFAGRQSLIARAEKRTVTTHHDGWMVAGEPKLGDAHDHYLVTLDGHRYRCSCYSSAWGDVRSHRICSHVLAVVFFRKRALGAAAGAGSHTPPPVPAAAIPDPRDPRFGAPPLPGWVEEFRPHQWTAVGETVAHFRSGKKVVLLDGPTGSGKTLIAELVRREMNVKGIYTCTTKTLQDQVLTDFPYAKVLKGRANYPTLDRPDLFRAAYDQRVTCDDCTKAPGEQCAWCWDHDACPYEAAKQAAVYADLAVLNTAYLLAEANYVGRFHPELVVADECDELEGQLMSFVEVTIGPRDRTRLDLDVPARKTVESAWVDWLDGAVQAARVELGRHPAKSKTPTDIKRRKKWERMAGQLAFVRDGVMDGGWVYDHSRPEWVTFKPITVDHFARDLLWRHSPRWLCMSATVISFDQIAKELGLGDDEWAAVQVPSTFPADRRPIHVVPVADLTYKTEEAEWEKAADALLAVLDLHPDERVLAHTQSYRLTQRLYDHLHVHTHRPLFTYRDAAGREEALGSFRTTGRAVLLAPSLQRGISLDDEACRVVVVVKMPFASTGDPQVSKRLYGTGRAGQLWYSVKTARTIVQSTGRGMRHADDWCEIYVLDKQFLNFWRRNKRLVPQWWRDAVDMSFDTRTLRRKDN